MFIIEHGENVAHITENIVFCEEIALAGPLCEYTSMFFCYLLQNYN